MPGTVHHHCMYMLQVPPSLCAAFLLVRRGGVIKYANYKCNDHNNHMTGRVCGHWPIGGHLLRQQRPHSPDVHLWLCTALLSPGSGCALQGYAITACLGFFLPYPAAVSADVAMLMCSLPVGVVSDCYPYIWAVCFCCLCKCLINESYRHCVSFVCLAVATSRYSNEELKKALRHDINDLARQKALQVHLSSTHPLFPERIRHCNLPNIQLAMNAADMLHLLRPSACLYGFLQGKAALMSLVEF